jgi:hypothetical protein
MKQNKITFKEISVEKAALLAAQGDFEVLYFLNSVNKDLHCIKNSGVKLTNIREKVWFEMVEVQ